MNKHLHRIIFNAARGIRMVVQETAVSTGKGSNKATGAAAAAVLVSLFASPLTQAQITGATNVPGAQRPTVLTAPNGVPLVNIQTPSAAGVSRNIYSRFDVQSNGVILNNSRTSVSTQLGATVQGNPWLASGSPARIILNEINSGSPSQLRGYVEVGGQRAEVIIANPAGISVDGGGFINASRATLTTGTPQFNAAGGLDSFLVRGGTITIEGAGLDASRTDYAAILTRALQVNAGIWATELKVVTGAGQTNADGSTVTPTASDSSGPAPTFALDVSHLGGMYAGKITLIGTEAGLGARNAGKIIASASGLPDGMAASLAGVGELVVTAAGRLENAGTLQADAKANLTANSLANSGTIASASELKISTQAELGNAGGTMEARRLDLTSATGDLNNSGGTLRQTSQAGLTVTAASLSNTDRGHIGSEPVPEVPSTPGTPTNPTTPGGTPETPVGGGTGTPTTPGAGGGTGGGTTPGPTPYVPPAPGVLTAAGALRNDGGRIYAGGDIAIAKTEVNNNGGTMNVASLSATGAAFLNQGGKMTVGSAFVADVGRFDNSGGTLHATDLRVTTTGDLLNREGTLRSDSDVNLQAGTRFDNTKGQVNAMGKADLRTSGEANNTDGSFIANQALSVAVGALDNTRGDLQSAGAATQVVASGSIRNEAGAIGAATDLTLEAGELTNGTGTLRAERDTKVSVRGAMTNAGSITAGQHTTLTAASLDSTSSSVLGAGIKPDGNLAATGNLSVTTTGALAAHGTNIAPGSVMLRGSSVDLSGSKTSGSGLSFTATQGDINTQGAQIATGGALSLTTTGKLVNDQGNLRASQLDIQAGSISNRSGELVQTGTGANRIAATGAFDNTQGLVHSAGRDFTLEAGGTLTNAQGRLEHSGTGTLAIDAGNLEGAAGNITGNGALTLQTGKFNQAGGTTSAQQVTIDAASLDNRDGKIIQTGTAATRITVTGDLNNTHGLIGTNGSDLRIAAQTLTNANGEINHAGTGALAITSSSLLGDNGKILSNGALTIETGDFQHNGATLSAQQVTIDAAQLGNQGGTITQTGTAATRITLSGALDNTDGQINTSGQDFALTASRLNNQGGEIAHAGTGNFDLTVSDTINNQSGKLVSNGVLTAQSASFVNQDGTVSAAQIAVETGELDNRAGAITQNGTGTTRIAVTGTLDNTGGSIGTNGQDVSVSTASLLNGTGHITHAGKGNFALAATQTLDNAAGEIASNGHLAVQAGAIGNQGGMVSAQQLTLDAASLNNAAGTIVQRGASATRITVTGEIDNTDGLINSSAVDMALSATTVRNGDGNIEHADATGKGSFKFAATDLLDNVDGKVVSNGILVLTGGKVDNRAGDISARQLSVAVGAIDNRGGDIVQSGTGTTSIAATGDINNADGTIASNGQNMTVKAGGTLTNAKGVIQHAGDGTLNVDAGYFDARDGKLLTNGGLAVRGGTFIHDGVETRVRDLSIDVQTLSNIGGQLVQTGTANTSIRASQSLNNTDGLIASNGADLTVAGGAINNNGGEIVHAGAGKLTLSGSQLTNQGGEITAKESLQANVTSLNNDGGSVVGQQVGIQSNSLSNRAGEILQSGTGNTAIVVVGAFDNQAGTLASNGQLNVAAGSLLNQGGTVNAAGSANLDLQIGGLLDNSAKGSISAGGTGSFKAGSLVNADGSLTAVRSLSGAVTNHLDNSGGVIGANGSTTLKAATLDNKLGTIAATKGDLQVTTTGLLNNAEGKLLADGKVTLASAGAQALNNDKGTVSGKQVSIDTTAGGFDNKGGTVAAAETVTIRSGALDNTGGLIQATGTLDIDTHGQRLTNANAAGHSSTQGGLTSQADLILRTGELDNSAGYIGAKDKIDAVTGYVANKSGGQIISMGSLDVNTQNAGYDNSGGQTMAVGDLGVAVGSGTFLNNGGLVRSLGTTTVTAGGISNSQTLGTDQGIEGHDVVLTTPVLDNSSGAIRANNNVTITATQKVVNDAGLISAKNIVRITDPNAPRALVLSNTGGTIVGDKSTIIEAASFGGDGAIVSGEDLTLSFIGDMVNTGELSSSGNLNYSATGNLTNNGKLIAALTLTASGVDVTNSAGAEMSGANTVINAAGTFTNHGLVNSNGLTRIQAATVNNTVGGRIYGDHVAIAAGTLNNDDTIAARQRLDIGAGTIVNRDGALIYSDGAMAIGGALDGANRATGQGGTLNNLSASIESMGDMNIAMGSVNNLDTHITRGPVITETTSAKPYWTVRNTQFVGDPDTVVSKYEDDGETSLLYLPNDPTGLPMLHRELTPGEQVQPIGLYAQSYHNDKSTITTDTVQNIRSASIVSGGNMNVTGNLTNQDSRVVAGGTLTASSVTNQAMQGERRTESTLFTIYYPQGSKTVYVPPVVETFALGGYRYESNTNATNGHNTPGGSTGPGGTGGQAGGIGGVNGLGGAGTIIEVPAAVDGTPGVGNSGVGTQTGGAGAGTATGSQATANSSGAATAADGKSAAGSGGTAASTNTANGATPASGSGGGAGGSTGASKAVPLVVRTSVPNGTIPTSSLFTTFPGPGGRYLIGTDAAFTQGQTSVSSDLLLQQLGLPTSGGTSSATAGNPFNGASTLKRLGDGFYEQRLVSQQIMQLTGYRYLEGSSNDEATYTALLNNGATFARQFNLSIGVALTPAQMAQLTSDIVWLVEQSVTLPDGTVERVLVPQVYVRVRPGDIDGGGALLSADAIRITNPSGNFTNTGTVAGRSVVSINADTIDHLAGRISGGKVGLDAKNDLNIIGATVDARNEVTLNAGRDINIRTSTQNTVNGLATGTNVDRVAGVYVTEAKGTLVASAGRDVNLVGSILVNSGVNSVTQIDAKRNINLGTVRESGTTVAMASNGWSIDSQSREIGSVIQGGGSIRLDAGNDLVARGATVAATGDLGIKAGRDITIESGREQTAQAFSSTSRSDGFLRSTTTEITGTASADRAIASTFSGQNVTLDGGRDINLVGSDVVARGDATLQAGRNVNVVSALEQSSATADRSRTTTGFVSKPTDHNLDVRRNTSEHAELNDQNERGASISAGGNLSVTAGKQVNVYASDLTAGQNLSLSGTQVTVLSGTDHSQASASTTNDRVSLGVTGVPVRMGQGFNGQSNVTNSQTVTTLAPATLSGRNVSITATAGDVTLGAAHISATDNVTLDAQHGAVNFDVVATSTSITQSRGENDLMYQRTRDNGAVSEQANYTTIQSGTLTVKAPTVNVQAGVPVNASRDQIQNGVYVPPSAIAQALADQAKQPGMGWIGQIQNDPALKGVTINWQGVPLEQRQWAERQGSLTETGGAVVAIVATVFTWGAAGTAGTAVAQGVGFTSTAVGTAGGAFAAAVAAGVSSIASQAAVSLINNNGDIAAVLDELASSRGLRNIATAALTGGLVAGLNAQFNLTGPAVNLTTGELFARGIIDGAASALVRSAVNGTSLEAELTTGILNGLISSGAASMANGIGGAVSSQQMSAFAGELAHALAGCVAGAASASVNGGTSAGNGCSAGAVGATAGHLAGQFFNPNGDPALHNQTVGLGQMVGAVAGAMLGGDAATVGIASAAGANAVENNLMSLIPRAVQIAQAGAGAITAEGAAILQACMRNAVCSVALPASVYTWFVGLPSQRPYTGGASEIPNEYGNGGYGGGYQPTTPQPTGYPYPPPATLNHNNTGGDQIANPVPGDNIVGGYGAGGLPSGYGGSTVSPVGGPMGSNVMWSEGAADVPRITIQDSRTHHNEVVADVQSQLAQQGYRTSGKEVSFGSGCESGRCRPDITVIDPSSGRIVGGRTQE